MCSAAQKSPYWWSNLEQLELTGNSAMKYPSAAAIISSAPYAVKREGDKRSSRRRSILVVDDESYILVLMGEVLSILGYRPLTAAKAADALQTLAQQAVDLVITDMEMPGMSGISLVQQIKQTYPALPVVLITGYGPERAARVAEECGADGFLGKPFHIEELRFCISRLIES
jgi:CheY-like chemotaxis protein